MTTHADAEFERFKPDVQFRVENVYLVTKDNGEHVKAGMLMAWHEEGWFAHRWHEDYTITTGCIPRRDETGKIPLYRDYWLFLANPNVKEHGPYFHAFFDAKKRRLR